MTRQNRATPFNMLWRLLAENRQEAHQQAGGNDRNRVRKKISPTEEEEHQALLAASRERHNADTASKSRPVLPMSASCSNRQPLSDRSLISALEQHPEQPREEERHDVRHGIGRNARNGTFLLWVARTASTISGRSGAARIEPSP